MSMKRRDGWPPPKKSLGQVLLVDDVVAREIVDSLKLPEGHNVLEIGPGRGILTKHLIYDKLNVTCCEIDERMGDLLKMRFGKCPTFSLILKDIMELSLDDVFPGEHYSVVGNLPYHLTSEIMFKCFEYIKGKWDAGEDIRVDSFSVMIQKEVANRILSRPCTRDWGVLSIYTSLFGEAEKLLDVYPDSFKPKPKVDSTVIKIKFRQKSLFEINDYHLFQEIIKVSFGKRRKMLRNTLARFNIPAQDRIDLQKRPEELSAEDFAYLAGCAGSVNIE